MGDALSQNPIYFGRRFAFVHQEGLSESEFLGGGHVCVKSFERFRSKAAPVRRLLTFRRREYDVA